MKRKIHETQQVPSTQEMTQGGVDEQLLELQRIEGNGPPKKVVWNNLPKPIRIFGYFIVICMFFMIIVGIVMTIFK
ncbi:hypothetical protein [Paenibacillus tyrfis]|uniref:hypothetical protein n=1 Tax=Paenibacillus tyrfis TaxID=1501230 RepID=UPI00069252E7|nr:hypothetical protein [Paenibacillus tyrfis]